MDHFFDHVAVIIERARMYVGRTADLAMCVTYFEIGRMIVEREQNGKDRAEYGRGLLIELSEFLNERFGRGFSVVNLKNARKFYQIYSPSIRQSLIAEFENRKLQLLTDESEIRIQQSLIAESKPKKQQTMSAKPKIRKGQTVSDEFESQKGQSMTALFESQKGQALILCMNFFWIGPLLFVILLVVVVRRRKKRRKKINKSSSSEPCTQ